MKYIGKRIVSNHQIGVIEFASVDIRAVFTNPDESANDLVFQLLVQKIFEHFCFEEAAARCVVGKEPVKEDGIVLFPIMFSSAQNYEKPKRKDTRHKTEQTED